MSPAPAEQRVPRRSRAALWALAVLAAALVLAVGWALTARWREGDAAVLGTAPAPPAGWTFEEGPTRVNAAGELVRFGQLTEDGSPAVRSAAVQVGPRWLVLPPDFEGGSFVALLTSPDGQRWLAAEQFDTEAAGDVSLLASDDGGRTFVHRATVPWPTYLASLDSVTFDGQQVELVLTLDDEAQLSEPWVSAWDTLLVRLGLRELPRLPAGRYVLRSSDGGRRFGRITHP